MSLLKQPRMIFKRKNIRAHLTLKSDRRPQSTEKAKKRSLDLKISFDDSHVCSFFPSDIPSENNHLIRFMKTKIKRGDGVCGMLINSKYLVLQGSQKSPGIMRLPKWI